MNQPKKPLGLWTLTALVVGNMIGSGIFLLPSDLASLGAASLISWGITAIGAFIFATLFAKLSLIVPKSGGPYIYAKTSLGSFFGFQTMFIEWIAIWVSIVGLAIASLYYLETFWPILANPKIKYTFLISIIWIITAVNIMGVRAAGRFQLFTTLIKLFPLLCIIIFGWWYFKPENLTYNIDGHFNTHIKLIADAASLTLWAFIGVESATIPYQFINNPKRNIPIATLLGTLIASIIYILSSTVIMGMLPSQILINCQFPFAIAATYIFGDLGKWIMSIGAAISCFGCINGWIFLQSQLTMVAADDNLFPKIFAKRNQAGVPAWGLIIMAILVTTILSLTLHQDLNQEFSRMISFVSATALIPYSFSAISAIILLKTHTQSKLEKAVFFTLAIIAGIYSLWEIITCSEKAIFYCVIIFFGSAILYGIGYRDNNAKPPVRH